MKSVLVSIQPKWCELIASGKKTIEVRKSVPKEVPFKCYIYQTKKRWIYKILPWLKERRQKVIGEFVCDRIINLKINGDDCGNYWHEWDDEGDIQDMCLSYEELETHLGKSVGYGWHISDLKIYDKPKELGFFRKPCNVSCMEQGNIKGDCGTCGELRTVIRPPQSWMYVEEL